MRLLRTSFGFDGVAITDAFSMAGVRAGRTLGEVAVETLIAGEDLLIVDNPPRWSRSLPSSKPPLPTGWWIVTGLHKRPAEHGALLNQHFR